MERSHVVKVEVTKGNRVRQGDVIRNIECIEYAIEEKGQVEVGLIEYPLVVVLTQDCDLEQDGHLRKRLSKAPEPESVNKGGLLLSVLVAPLYNAEQVYLGDHLSDLELKVASISKDSSPGKNLRNNETPRYHYLEFPNNIPVPNSVIDFKHFFTVNRNYIAQAKRTNFVCTIGDLFREDISQRFASFLGRIGLPVLDPSGRKVNRITQVRAPKANASS